jgi:uncharacterized membrane protein
MATPQARSIAMTASSLWQLGTIDRCDRNLMDSNSDNKLSHKFSIRPRLWISLLLAGIVAIFLPSWLDWTTRIFCVWNVVMISFLGLTWRLMFRATPEMMQRSALKEDEGRWIISIAIAVAACISLLAVGSIPHQKNIPTSVLMMYLGLSISTIVGSWLLVHTIFTQHYAHLYYQGDKTLAERKSTGLEFPGEIEPDYWDFLYFSFVIGMTGQVSDVNVRSRQMRRLSLLHGILSFFYNTTILAISINIVAGII